MLRILAVFALPTIVRGAGEGSLRGSSTTGAESSTIVNASADLGRTADLNSIESFCVDTPDWTNGWKPCNREALGNDPNNCKAGSGWTCAGYVAKGWCRNDRCLSSHETGGVYACGAHLNSPELNCCACGKGSAHFVVTCAKEGCGGAYKSQNTCQCTYECEKYNNCCSDFKQVCQRNPPAPAPAVLCKNEGCGGAYKPKNSCQCTDECEKYNNCCEDYWSVCKHDKPPSVTYEEYDDRNAFYPHGATNIDTDYTAPTGLSVQQCQDRCTQDEACSCVTFKPQEGKCWKRGNCVESGWAYDQNFDVYMKKVQSCLPEHAECGGPGRHDGECCSGTTCESLVGTDLKYCAPASSSYYMQFYDKNAYYPYGATDIDDQKSAPTGLTPQQCMDRCSNDWQCSCVTLERSTGKCWKRASCKPDGWTSSHNVGYNVYMKSQPHAHQSAAVLIEKNATEPLLNVVAPDNETEAVLFP